MEARKYGLGDVVRLKKPHPCGSYEWEITRMGADIKIRCCKCNRQVMLPRSKFEKRIKQIISNPGQS